MEECSLISEKINSKYIYQIIFSYIKIKSYKLNLFKYSKKYQKKFEIKLIDYIKEYLSNQNISFKSYFSFKHNFNKVEDKTILKSKLNNYLNKLKLDFNSIEEFAIESYQEENGGRIKVDIYSPFFDSLLKKEISQHNFEIRIPIDKIENFELKNDYISACEKINNSEMNTNYPCVNFKYRNPDDINYLKDLKLNFNLIKQLKLKQIKNEKEKENDNIEKKSFDNFYKTLFSLPDIKNILVDLDLRINGDVNKIAIPNSFEEINNLKALKNLIIKGYSFENSFTLKLFDLKSLRLLNVTNISFDEANTFNLESLYLHKTQLKKSENLINFPKLETFLFIDSSNINSINLKEMKCLKLFYIDSYIFSTINNNDLAALTSLEEIQIFSNIKKIITTINNLLLIPKIKTAVLISSDIYSEDVKNIEGENLSLENLYIRGVRNECTLSTIQKLFPNIKEVEIHSHLTEYDLSDCWCGTCRMELSGKCYNTNIIIKENQNCKTDKINIVGEGCRKMELFCNSYENLKEIRIELENQVSCITLPIFFDKDSTVFKSLNTFIFNISDKSKDKGLHVITLKNIYNYLDKMPNLKNFQIVCYSRNITKEFYLEFVKKVLSINLDIIVLSVRFNIPGIKLYSRKELTEIYPNINHLDFSNIAIYKFD